MSTELVAVPSPSGSPDFKRAVRAYGADKTPRDIAAEQAVKSLMPIAVRMPHEYADGHLKIHLADQYLSPMMPSFVAAVQGVPLAASLVTFVDNERGTEHPYNEVVWDIERHPASYASRAFHGGYSDARLRILLTPAVSGNNSRDRSVLDCRKVSLADSPLPNTRMIMRLHAESAEWRDIDGLRGQRHLVQTRGIKIADIEDISYAEPTIFMNVKVPEHCHYASAPATKPMPGYDGKI